MYPVKQSVLQVGLRPELLKTKKLCLQAEQVKWEPHELGHLLAHLDRLCFTKLYLKSKLEVFKP